MSKKLSLTDMIDQLQRENEQLQSLKKLFEKAVHDEFGYSVKEVHSIIRYYSEMQKKKSQPHTTQGQQSATEQSEG